MTILRKLLAEIDSESNLDKLRQLCDEIFKEERENIKHIKILPRGPNLFLVLQVPGKMKGDISFLALERESENLYLSVLFTTTETEYKKSVSSNDAPKMKRKQVWQIKDSRPEAVLTEYAKKYKFLRGE